MKKKKGTTLALPEVTDFPPYGIDIFVKQSQLGTYAKITGFANERLEIMSSLVVGVAVDDDFKRDIFDERAGVKYVENGVRMDIILKRL